MRFRAKPAGWAAGDSGARTDIANGKTACHHGRVKRRMQTGWLGGWMWLLTALPSVASEYAFVTNADETITLTAYHGIGGDVRVPDRIGERWVTGIGDFAFFEMDGLVSIAIPDSVKWIGADAFMFCHGLESAMLGTNVAQIGAGAFYECTSLLAIHIPAATTHIGADAFVRCTRLAGITVSSANPAYRDVDGVLYAKDLSTLIQFPGGKTGDLHVAEGATHVRDRALSDCGGLRNVAFGTGVTHIGADTFRSTRKLEGAYFAGDAPAHGAGVFDDVDKVVVYRAAERSGWGDNFAGRPTDLWPSAGDFGYVQDAAETNTLTVTGYLGDDEEPFVPAFFAEEPGRSITRIGTRAFSMNTNLTGVGLSCALREIGMEAFEGCSWLADMAIPDSVTHLGARALRACVALTNVIAGAGLVQAGDGAFADCPELAGIHFRGDAPDAGAGLFDGSSKVTAYHWPPRAGWEATYGGRPTAIWYSPGDFACTTNGHDTNTVTIHGYHGPDSIVPIPEQIQGRLVTDIGYRAMYGQRDVAWASIPATVTNIEDEAFLYSHALAHIRMTDGVRRIGDRAFAQTRMDEIILPASVVELGTGVFEFSSLTGIYAAGSAPMAAGDIADPGSVARVHYLPGMTGWGATYGGRPTALWLPRAQGEGLGATEAGFGLSVAWAAGKTVVLEGCENLLDPVWIPVETNVLANGTGAVVDRAWTNHHRRYYRLKEW